MNEFSIGAQPVAGGFIACLADGCTKSARRGDGGRGGYCRNHYIRKMRHGSPSGGLKSPMTLHEWVRTVALPFTGDECLDWPFGRNPAGYGQMKVDGCQMNASRYVCLEAHGAPPTDGLHAAHSCGRGHLGCVNPRHLSWKTATENQLDKVSHGTHSRREKSPSARLNQALAEEIKASTETNISKLARQFGVSRTTIRRVKSGVTWGDYADE